MSIIYSYQTETNVLGTDLLIGTSTEVVNGKEENVTRNYTIQSIADFATGGSVIDPAGSDFFIPVFNQSGKKITNSVIQQDSLTPTTVTITSPLTSIIGGLNVSGNTTLGLNETNTLTISSTTSLLGPIKDSLGVLGGTDQVLVGQPGGRVTWQAYQSGLTYKGTWNASTNTPTLSSGVGVTGEFYIVSVAGTTNLDGINDWQVGDWAIFTEQGTIDAWQKIDSQSSTFTATSGSYVNLTPNTTQAGAVVLSADLVNSGTTPSNAKFYRGDGSWAIPDGQVYSVDTIAAGTSTGNAIVITPTTQDVKVQSMAYAGGTNVGHVPSGSGNNVDLWLNGQGGWTSPPGGYDKWVLEGDNATTVDVLDDLRVDFTGGTGITTAVTAGTPNLLTITNDGVLDVALGTLSTSTGNPLTLNLAAGVETITPHFFAGGANVGFVPSAAGVSGDEFLKRDGSWALVPADGISSITTNTPNQLGITNNGAGLTTNIDAQIAAITGVGTTSLATGAQIVSYVTSLSVDDLASPPGDFNMNNHKITNVLDPTNLQDVATKTYVDNALAGSGSLIYQGGYDAANNSPNLDTPAGAGFVTVSKGWTYTVTSDGSFFTEQVRAGDVLIANVNSANSLSDWTTVQNNVDLASASVVGIGNVVPGSSNTITAPYTTGTATLDVVDSSATQKGAVIVAGSGTVNVSYSSGTATLTSADQNIYQTIGVPGQTDLVAYSATSKIDFVNGTGITMTTATGTPNLLTVTNSDRGSSQNIFKTVAVSGQTDIVAGSNTDTLNLVGSGITITSNAATNTLTFTGGTSYVGWTAGATAGTSDVIDSSDTLDFKAAYSNPSGITQSDTYFKTTISTAGTTKTITFAPHIGAAGVATANTLVDRDGSGNIWVTTVNGELDGTISSATTATTQSVGDNTTKVATTAFVQANSGDVNTVTITVQTVSGSNYFFIDGTQQGAITILPGFTYRLDQSAASNSTHPLLLSENPDNSPSAPFTTGVTTVGTPGSAGVYTQVILEQDAPKLYYYCQNHSGMGGEINSDGGSMSTWKLDGDSGPEQTVNDGELVQLLGTAGNITTEAKASRTVEVDLATVGAAQTNVPLATVSIDTFGRVTALSAGTTGTYAQSVISTNTTAQAGYLYVFTASLALTLPTGAVGSSIKISNLSNTATCTLNPAAGEKIMALGQTMTLDTNYAAFELIYTDATNGWIIVGAN